MFKTKWNNQSGAIFVEIIIIVMVDQISFRDNEIIYKISCNAGIIWSLIYYY